MPFQRTQTPEEIAAFDRGVLHMLLQCKGKSNAVDRWDLVERVFGHSVPADQRNDANLEDREIRTAVGRLRTAGHLICDVGNGAGRWIAASKEEFREFYSYYVAPIKSRASVARAMKKAAQEQFSDLMQLDLFSLDGLELS